MFGRNKRVIKYLFYGHTGRFMMDSSDYLVAYDEMNGTNKPAPVPMFKIINNQDKKQNILIHCYKKTGVSDQRFGITFILRNKFQWALFAFSCRLA
jgi:hypothetical protein